MQPTTSNRDSVLFARISEGDEAAFEQLYHAYLPELYPVIMQVVRTELVVKDIIQEVFLYLWMDREKLSGIEEPRHWIFRMAYNRSYSWVKKQVIRNKAAATIQQEQQQVAASSDTENAIDFSEASRLVLEAIQQLAPKSQQIYRLSLQEGLKPAAIADMLAMDVQVVKNSLYRSGKTIKTYLATRGIIIPIALLIAGQ